METWTIVVDGVSLPVEDIHIRQRKQSITFGSRSHVTVFATVLNPSPETLKGIDKKTKVDVYCQDRPVISSLNAEFSFDSKTNALSVTAGKLRYTNAA